MPDDPYDTLGVRRDASPEEVRRAFVRLARRYHPDYFTDAAPAERAEAEARMREVNDAWAVLGDPQRRRRHDDEAPGRFEPFSAEDDEPDPRDAPDVPYRPPPAVTTGRRLTTMAPVLLFGGSVAVGAVAMVVDLPALFGLSLVLFVSSCAGFVVLPLLALSRARQDEG